MLVLTNVIIPWFMTVLMLQQRDFGIPISNQDIPLKWVGTRHHNYGTYIFGYHENCGYVNNFQFWTEILLSKLYLHRKRSDEFTDFDAPRFYGRIWTPGAYYVNEILRFEGGSFRWRPPTSKHFITRPNFRMRLYKDGNFVFIQRYALQLKNCMWGRLFRSLISCVMNYYQLKTIFLVSLLILFCKSL